MRYTATGGFGVPSGEPWRTFEVTTRVEVLKPSGTTRVWLPAALLRDTTFQKTLANDFRAEGGTVELVRSDAHSLGIVSATFPDGVRTIDIGPAISPGGIFREEAMYRGRMRVIRQPDGIHLANAGVHLATEVILRAMRREGVATP